ncbi:MAG: DUF4124 domain-containing protein [Gammaproteobacteria bacterium]
MRQLTTSLLFLFIFPAGIQAAIYKSVDANGNVSFSDQPSPNAKKVEEIKLDPATLESPAKSRTTIKLRPPEAQVPTEEKARTDYDELRIFSPENNETIRSNNGDLNVDIFLLPAVREKLGHKLVLLLDGKAVSEPGTATNFALHGVDRGKHTLSAKIVGKNGKTLKKSTSVTVHLKRYSKLLNPNRPPPGQ